MSVVEVANSQIYNTAPTIVNESAPCVFLPIYAEKFGVSVNYC